MTPHAKGPRDVRWLSLPLRYENLRKRHPDLLPEVSLTAHRDVSGMLHARDGAHGVVTHPVRADVTELRPALLCDACGLVYDDGDPLSALVEVLVTASYLDDPLSALGNANPLALDLMLTRLESRIEHTSALPSAWSALDRALRDDLVELRSRITTHLATSEVAELTLRTLASRAHHGDSSQVEDPWEDSEQEAADRTRMYLALGAEFISDSFLHSQVSLVVRLYQAAGSRDGNALLVLPRVALDYVETFFNVPAEYVAPFADDSSEVRDTAIRLFEVDGTGPLNDLKEALAAGRALARS